MSWKWTQLFFFIFLVEGLVMWRSSEGTSSAKAVYLVRQGENVTVSCWKSWFSRYKDAHYTWLDHLDRGAARNDMILHGDGSMEITVAQLSDTDNYKCIIHLAGATTEDHMHTVIVYTIAEYYMSYPFIYFVTECNYQLNNFKMHELHEFVCRDYEKNCPFHAVTTCNKYQSSLSQEERSQLTVFIKQYPLDVYRPPSCDVFCIKKSIVEHFDLMGSYIIRELYNVEQSSQRKIYGNIAFSRDTSARLADVRARCQSGYELYQDIICMPCYPGHSLKNTFSNEDELSLSIHRVHQRCEMCPSDQYQDSFGMEECFYCPKQTFTSSNGSVSQELCRKKGYSISWTLLILCGLLAAFLATICCTWMIMACIAGTHKWKSEKTAAAAASGQESEFPPLSDQQPWIELLRQCEESNRSSPVGSTPIAYSPTPVAVEAPAGTVPLRSSLKQRSPTDEATIDATSDLYPQQFSDVYAQRPPDVYPLRPPDVYPQRPPDVYPQQFPDVYRQQSPDVYPQQSPDVYPRPPSTPIEYYSPMQTLPEMHYAGPPSPLPPVPVAVATPYVMDRGTSLVSARPALRPIVRQPVPLASKASDTNIYRLALNSGLREVRIAPPGSNQSSGEGPSRATSAENWSQHSVGGGNPRAIGPSNTSSNSKQTSLPIHYAQLTPVEPPPSTPSRLRDQSGILVSGEPLRGFRSVAQLGQQSRGLPVEIEVEFQRVPPSAARHRRLASSHSGGQKPQAFDQQFEANATAPGLESQPELPPQQVDLHSAIAHHRLHVAQAGDVRQRFRQQQQQLQPVTMPQITSSGTEPPVTGTQSAIELQSQSSAEVWPQPIDNIQPQSFVRSSIPRSQSSQQQIDFDGKQSGLEPYHLRRQSSASNQASDAEQNLPKKRLTILKRRRTEPQTPSQQSSETNQRPSQQSSETNQRPSQQSSETNQRPSQQSSETNQRPSQQSSETNQRPSQQSSETYQRPSHQSSETYQRPSQQPSETNQRLIQQSSETGGRYTASQHSLEVERYMASRQSSETDHHRSAMATHQHHQSGPEATSQGQPSRRMRKALIDAINARSAPTHEDTNIYD